MTPPPLASQWVDELKAHAPSLKVLVYDGWSKVKVPITRSQVEEERKRRIKEKKKKKKDAALKKSLAKAMEWTGDGEYESDWDSDFDSDMDEDIPVEEDKEEEIVDWCTYVHGFDVVITTYTTLRNDLNVARAAPTRPRREDVVYSNVERPRSPLVMVEWNRVVMDEVQMVGGGKTECVRFHQINAFVSDLFSVQRHGFSHSSSFVFCCLRYTCADAGVGLDARSQVS